MPSAHPCPDLGQYKKLVSGEGSPAEKEALLGHLEACDACARRLERLSDKDTLVDLIRQAQTLSGQPERETIARLVERLRGLRLSGGAAEMASTTDPLRFACSRCGKTLKVKAGLAGKKVKCPHCNVTVRVPAGAEGASLAEARTLAPVNPAATHVTTASGQFVEAPAKELYDFLAPPQAPDSLGRLGPYRVLRILGHGGMGVVFEAEDPQLRRKVALKAMLPGLAAGETARQRFLREARVAAAVEHDHIVSIYQVGEDRGVPFIAMAFLKGESLDHWLARQPRLPFRAVLRIARETAAGLAAAHKQGLIHRDIKPANLWIEEGTNRIKILDFGLARAATDSAHLTHSGAIVGTPAYMAPEQANGLTLDARCDLFSLGSVLYRVTTGVLPFKGNDTVSTLMAVATHDPPRPSQVNAALSEEFSDLIMQLLAKDPGSRTPSAQALLKALTRIEEQGRAPTGTYQGTGVSATASRKPDSHKSLWKNPLVLRIGLWTLPLFVLAGLIIMRFSTDKGDLVIETDGPDVELVISQGGKQVTIIDTRTNQQIELATGTYELALSKGQEGLRLSTDKFTLSRGAQKIVYVHREPAKQTGDPPSAVVSAPGDTATAHDKLSSTPFLARGDWRIENGELVQANLGGGQFGPALVLGDETLSTYDLVVDVKKTGATGRENSVGICFHWLGPEQYRQIQFDQDGGLDCSCVNSGKWNPEHRAWKPLGYLPDQWYTLKLEVRGATYRAYVDNAFQFALTDARFTHGRVGLFTSMATARFRHIRLTDPSGRVLFGEMPTLLAAAGHEAVPPTPDAATPNGKNLVRIPLEQKKATAVASGPHTAGSQQDVSTEVPEFSRQPVFVKGDWMIENDELVHSTLAVGSVLVLGEETLSNYDLTLQMKKTGGHSAMGVHFHWQGPGHYRDFAFIDHKALDFGFIDKGVWGRDTDNGGWKWLRYSSNRWYTLKLEVRGASFRASLDGVMKCQQSDARFTHGRIALFTSIATARFRQIRVSNPEGRTLFEGLPELPPVDSQGIAKANTGNQPRLLTVGETAAKNEQQQWAARLKIPVISTNSLGMKLTLIPPGEFQMGSIDSERERRGNEQRHPVRITKPFYLGVYETTQTGFEHVMGRNRSAFQNTGSQSEVATGVDTSRYPVENVCWYDAVEFCNKLSAKEGRRPYYRLAVIKRDAEGRIKQATVSIQGGGGYRLPTEAQWEYACRAGTTTPFNFGTTNNAVETNCNGETSYGTDESGPALNRCVPVGSYRPNAFGLYDMDGNVQEWCWDVFDEAYYERSPLSDPAGPSAGSLRVIRGGCWSYPAADCRSACRWGQTPDFRPFRLSVVGFRVACDAGE